MGSEPAKLVPRAHEFDHLLVMGAVSRPTLRIDRARRGRHALPSFARSDRTLSREEVCLVLLDVEARELDPSEDVPLHFSPMPRTVTAEESLVASKHEVLQRTKAFETGLVLAHVGCKADTLLRFAPTPEEEGGFMFKKGEVDAKWMLQHAELVTHMLPGGVSAIGCYAFAPGAKLAKLEASLQPVVAFLAKRIQGLRPETRQAVLLLLPSDAKKVSAKALSVGSDGAVINRLSPLELKLMPSPPQVSARAS
jgi:hypothetical protein